MTDDAERLTPPTDAPQIRVIAMPADTNPNGDIFGGWLLSWMDQAAASAAYEAAQGRCVTVAVDAMVFHNPVFVGDEVSLYARVNRRGRTSVGVFVEAWRRPRAAGGGEGPGRRSRGPAGPPHTDGQLRICTCIIKHHRVTQPPAVDPAASRGQT